MGGEIYPEMVFNSPPLQLDTEEYFRNQYKLFHHCARSYCFCTLLADLRFNAEAYLGPWQTSAMKLFRENNHDF